MIIGKNMRGNPRLKLDIMEAEGSNSTGNSLNTTYSLYEPKFWEVFNEVAKTLFDNFTVTVGRTRRFPGKRVRVILSEALYEQQDGISRSLSVRSAKVQDVIAELEDALTSKYGEEQ